MSRSNALVLPFSDIRATDLPLVGGKGANLGEMAAAGFPVPPGFCLTTAAFRRFMAGSTDAEQVYALLETVTTESLDAVREVGPRVRETL
ncbi:MAG: phosphoenolpyruvate synthase, partial [Caldilineae bacterium]